jgi:hypothetical protein
MEMAAWAPAYMGHALPPPGQVKTSKSKLRFSVAARYQRAA